MTMEMAMLPIDHSMQQIIDEDVAVDQSASATHSGCRSRLESYSVSAILEIDLFFIQFCVRDRLSVHLTDEFALIAQASKDPTLFIK